MLVATHLMETDFAHWRLWAAKIRERNPEGHQLRKKAQLLCYVLDSWHNAWLFERRPNSARNLTKTLEEPIEKLVGDLLRLGVAPPEMPKNTKVRKNTALTSDSIKPVRVSPGNLNG